MPFFIAAIHFSSVLLISYNCLSYLYLEILKVIIHFFSRLGAQNSLQNKGNQTSKIKRIIASFIINNDFDKRFEASEPRVNTAE